jgi:hypothetical protein
MAPMSTGLPTVGVDCGDAREGRPALLELAIGDLRSGSGGSSAFAGWVAQARREGAADLPVPCDQTWAYPPSAVRSSMACGSSRAVLSRPGVLVGPGLNALTRKFLAFELSAQLRTRLRTAALLAP